MRRGWTAGKLRFMTGVILLAGLFAVGCSGQKGFGEVRGTVTYRDKPVTAGTVMFYPEGGGDPASGVLAPDGTYRATGIPVGRARVAVETARFKTMTPPPAGLAKQMGGPRPVYVPIPDRYEKPESSGLTFEVVKGTSDWPIVLTD
jgi:hypothetical protein